MRIYLSFMFLTLPSRIETFRNLILDWSLVTLKFIKRKEGKKFHISTFAVSYSCKHKTENSWKELCAEILAENCSQGTLCDAIFVKSISKDNGKTSQDTKTGKHDFCAMFALVEVQKNVRWSVCFNIVLCQMLFSNNIFLIVYEHKLMISKFKEMFTPSLSTILQSLHQQTASDSENNSSRFKFWWSLLNYVALTYIYDYRIRHWRTFCFTCFSQLRRIYAHLHRPASIPPV